MSKSRMKKGARGEQLAADFLENRGFKILRRNVHQSHLEIDIIGKDGDCLVFVEVKYATSEKYGHPATWIDDRKQEKLRRAAELYIRDNHISGVDIRFDVITIDRGEIEYYQNAF